MAQGFDMAIAQACVDLRVPFIAARPFPQQADRWPITQQHRYHAILRCAKRVHTQMPVALNRAYILRDQWIVDRCEELAALDSGRPSGSHTTVLYAQEVGRKVIPLWDEWIRFRGR